MTTLRFRFLDEAVPDAAWREIVDHGWPGWKEWFESREGDDGPSAHVCRRAIRRHLPGIEGLLDTLTEAAGGDERFARFLSFWSPPRYLVNCTQLALSDDEGPLMIRNYDLDPSLNESTMLRSAWRGRKVIGMVEAMAGLSDGMNAFGLAASLTFGGRVAHGDGFGIPLVIRYLLEYCRDVQDGLGVLRSIPVHMSYNVTLTDPSGDVATVMLSPDRPTMISHNPWAANHQIGVEWPHHGRLTKTIERAERLDQLLAKESPSAAQLKREFLSEPIYSSRYSQGFGTVFTSIYRPIAKTVEIGWHDGSFVEWDLVSPSPAPLHVHYDDTGSSVLLESTAWPDRGTSAAWQQMLDPWRKQRMDAFRSRNQEASRGDWTNLNVTQDENKETGA